MPLPETFKALRVTDDSGQTTRAIVQHPSTQMPEGDLIVKVSHSALNYKDALSATGNRGVTRKYPHTPGIDAAGTVVSDDSGRFKPGDAVIVTSYDLGMNTDGGFGEYIRVPAAWAVPMPEGMDARSAMIYGTAGFTAGLALFKMERIGQTPEMGPIVVTGASGGVGSMAVAILAKAGYEVIASTGKDSEHKYLKQLGASQIEPRAFVDDESGRPLLRSKWAGAIDTVGGNTLATLLKACNREGSVAVCGLVASPKLDSTVFPFILNGVNMLGVESATCAMEVRQQVWDSLASKWAVDELELIAHDCTLEQIHETYIDEILAGRTRGRMVVSL
ncbi:YhdH/YhfP family quinone oxidoreductase [Pontibacter sp. G13]|uniref:YhdH/YhfP family quinone oxidoreductase n=1 Tax=Pontibacter sp. G13 TaxID=3074898 RepID=UPI0028895499|nr:YhdH/YhfP family quinone oxidoreductase [Pontibacter sp. G13]WNJ19537.1 YhdH/YhfP family quinone oxidoreductase [Pontibacter sp. G13]